MKLKEMFRRYFFTRERDSAIYLGRAYTRDATIPFLMQAGFQGDVNRSHPCTIEPALADPTYPPTFYGQAVVADAAAPNGVRVPQAGDAAAAIYGVTVRPFPIQPTTGSLTQAFGSGTPPANVAVDVLRSGYIIVLLQGAAAAAKGTAVKVCTVAGAGYVVGGFSVDAVAGTEVTLDGKSSFNGPADVNGLVELAFNI